MPELGLIEGFFGRPWSWADRAEAVRFLRPHGYRLLSLRAQGRSLAAPPLAGAASRGRAGRAGRACATSAAPSDVRFGIGLSPFELHLHAERGWQERARGQARVARSAQARRSRHPVRRHARRRPRSRRAPGGDRPLSPPSAASPRGSYCCPSYYSDDPILDVAFGAAPAFLSRATGPPARSRDPHLLDRRGGRARANSRPGHLARVAGQLRPQADALGQLSGQ